MSAFSLYNRVKEGIAVLFVSFLSLTTVELTAFDLHRHVHVCGAPRAYENVF